MPGCVKTLYVEASAVVRSSPRAAAALLRVSIETLADHFHAVGHQVGEKVTWLVANKGLDPEIAVALHSVHLVGNHATHPGEIDFADDTSIEHVMNLFEAVNLIVDELITRKAKRDALWALVPEADRKKALQNDIKAMAKLASGRTES